MVALLHALQVVVACNMVLNCACCTRCTFLLHATEPENESSGMGRPRAAQQALQKSVATALQDATECNRGCKKGPLHPQRTKQALYQTPRAKRAVGEAMTDFLGLRPKPDQGGEGLRNE